MSDTEKKVMETLSQILPALPEKEHYRLLGYGEGVMATRQEKEGRSGNIKDSNNA